MMPDHYATLGVSPTAKAAVIRAAYLALLRQYHPDRNSSPAAVERAQTIIAAFKVLGDFDRRNHYDWDRRRAREAAAALAAKSPPKVSAAMVAGAIGLVAAGALVFTPTPKGESRLIDPPVAETRTLAESGPVARAKPRPELRRIAVRDANPGAVKVKVEKRDPVEKPKPRIEPVRVAKVEPMRPKPNVERASSVRPKPNVERAPLVRVASVKSPGPLVTPVPVAPRQAKATAKPDPPAARPQTELAALDQFVMSYYGQSWRFGDPPKRAVLEQTRASFVARREACSADPCKRAAYLKLMRDVSQIVENGQPSAR